MASLVEARLMVVRDLASGNPLPAQAEVRVFLRTADGEPLGGPFGRLARLFGLDVYGTSLLSRRARLEMKFAALLLLVVILFDFAAWSLLLNAIFHSTILALSPWSLAALFAAALLSAVVFLYERQFLTTDTSRRGWRLSIPIAFRLVVVVAAALITAQPVELLFFRSAIADRAHQEGIREELTTRLGELREMEGEVERLRAELAALPRRLEQEIEFKDRQEAAGELAELRTSRASLTVERDRARREEERWSGIERSRAAATEPLRRELRRLEASSPAAEELDDDGLSALDRARRDLERATASQRAASRERASHAARKLALDGQIAVVQELEDEAGPAFVEANERFQRRRAEIEQGIEGRAGEVDRQRERLRDWIRQLRRTETGAPEPILEPADAVPEAVPRFVYSFPRDHFFEQLRVLSDLRSGRPPLWEGAAGAEREALAREFGLADPQDCKAEGAPTPCDDVEWRRHRAATRGILWAYVVVYGIALVIPLLVLALKFLIPPELKAYYTASEQARAGQPDALRLTLL